MEASGKPLRIDIEDVIGSKNPKLLKSIPGFLIKYIKRVIHQDDINVFLNDNQAVFGLDFVRNSLEYLGAKYEAFGVENIPTKGRYVFVSNHPLGGLDGLVLLDAIGKHFPDVKFVVNDLLMNLKNLDPVFVPVNKHGRQSSTYARMIDEAYASNTQILFFPAGLCSRKIRGEVTDLNWHKSFLVKSIRYQRDVIPVYFEGRNSNFFYNLSNIRTIFGLKANVEMLYLVDEMFKQQGKAMKLVFGKPISYQKFTNEKTQQEWVESVRNEVYSLQGQI